MRKLKANPQVTKSIHSGHLSFETRMSLYAALRAEEPKLDICKRFEISERSYYHHKEIALGKRALSLHPVLKLSPEQRQQAFAMRDAGETYWDIAIRLNASQSQIFRLINRSKHNPAIEALSETIERVERPSASKYIPSMFIQPLSKERLMGGR